MKKQHNFTTLYTTFVVDSQRGKRLKKRRF